MNRERIEALRARISCDSLLLQAGFALDRRQSSRRALKFRRGAEILIVTHQGAGWFDPLSEKKGDVFALASLLEGISFAAAVERLGSREQIGGWPFQARVPLARRDPVAVLRRWSDRSSMRPMSPTFLYLNEIRGLPSKVLHLAVEQDLLRQGPFGSAWFRHDDEGGRLSGWEERGPAWRRFSNGGAKTLFRFGPRHPTRICITEAAIDALSLAVIEQVRADTLYASTGGGWSPSTVRAIEDVLAHGMLVAATDADPQGDVYADRLRRLAGTVGADFRRLRPQAIDWNEELIRRGDEGDLAHARQTASRVKLRPPDGGP